MRFVGVDDNQVCGFNVRERRNSHAERTPDGCGDYGSVLEDHDRHIHLELGSRAPCKAVGWAAVAPCLRELA